MVCHIISAGVGGEQFGAVVEIYSNHKRVRFGRTVSRDAGEELPLDLQGWNAEGRCHFHIGQSEGDVTSSVEGDV